MSDYDDDNICGFDMDYDGDKDFYDDLIYDDWGTSDIRNSGGVPNRRRSRPKNRLLGWIITFIVIVIILVMVTGSFEGIIVSALLFFGIIWFFVNFMTH